MEKTAKSSSTLFQMETEVSIKINATKEKIMDLLTNAEEFTKWNSTIILMEGKIAQG